uniref:Uncharacterized protein n=1 Tax=Acrobeloides nanus TaxID=290746 RepID=A0A914C649_9BILA
MAWYSRHWIVIPQYIVPLLFSGFSAYTFFAFKGVKKVDIKFIGRSLHDANICINAILLLFITYKGYASGFIFMILALFPLLRLSFKFRG